MGDGTDDRSVDLTQQLTPRDQSGSVRRILIIADLLPFPARANGFTIRYAPIIEHLAADNSVEFVLLARGSATESATPLNDQTPIPVHRIPVDSGAISVWRRVLTRAIAGFFDVPPYPVFHYGESSIVEPLRELCERRSIDTVILTHPEVIGAVEEAIGNRRLIVDAIDSRYLTVLRQTKNSLVGRYDAWHTRRWERRLPERADHVSYISEFDRNSVHPDGATRDVVSVIPNGVLVSPTEEITSEARCSTRIAFLGHMAYRPNVRAAQRLAHLMPRLRERVPSAELRIIGRSPAAEVESLRQQEGVTVTGDVPSIWPELASAAIACFPMEEGAGQQNKLLEAMHARCAVVTSTIGNLGVRGQDGVDLLIRDSDAQLVDALAELLQNPVRSSALGSAGHEFVHRHYSWPASFERIRKYWLEL